MLKGIDVEPIVCIKWR